MARVTVRVVAGAEEAGDLGDRGLEGGGVGGVEVEVEMHHPVVVATADPHPP